MIVGSIASVLAATSSRSHRNASDFSVCYDGSSSWVRDIDGLCISDVALYPKRFGKDKYMVSLSVEKNVSESGIVKVLCDANQLMYSEKFDSLSITADLLDKFPVIVEKDGKDHREKMTLADLRRANRSLKDSKEELKRHQDYVASDYCFISRKYLTDDYLQGKLGGRTANLPRRDKSAPVRNESDVDILIDDYDKNCADWAKDV